MQRKKILVVDDEKRITDMLVTFLTDKYEVLSENNGSRALGVAKEFSPDLIILDVDFPDITGGEIAGHPFLSKPAEMVELFECIENNLKKAS